ncbi:MAG: DUF488 family protein [Deltaproteobacteria bacterium]|nr:DUF488 family protein [Deltaproteobacteria bacterium]
MRAARTHAYAAGLERVLDLSRRAKVALLGVEEDPAHCHRYTLLAPDLEARREAGEAGEAQRQVRVWHLRGNDKLEDDEAVQRRRESGAGRPLSRTAPWTQPTTPSASPS